MSDKLPGPRRLIYGSGELALCGDPAVTLGKRSWTADETTAYILFQLSFAFPNVSNYGDGIHASVIARSFCTMDAKPVNSSHQMQIYGSANDAILGTVVGIDYPETPAGGWKTTKDKAGAPFMTGVAALWLTAAPTEKWIARYTEKRKPVAVSMEVLYAAALGGFAVSRNGEQRIKQVSGGAAAPPYQDATPAEFFEAGWEYVPMSALLSADERQAAAKDAKQVMRIAAAAPKGSLLRTRDFKAKRMIGGSLMGSGLVGSWTAPGEDKPRDVYFLQGGVAGEVFYPGMGIVEQGAEPRAGIETMLAEAEEAVEMGRALEEMTEAVKNAAGEL